MIELQSEAIKINCSIGYEDVLDETEGSVSLTLSLLPHTHTISYRLESRFLIQYSEIFIYTTFWKRPGNAFK